MGKLLTAAAGVSETVTEKAGLGSARLQGILDLRPMRSHRRRNENRPGYAGLSGGEVSHLDEDVIGELFRQNGIGRDLRWIPGLHVRRFSTGHWS
jgi:hypothetical protein